MDYVIFAIVMVFPCAECVMALRGLVGDHRGRLLATRFVMVMATGLALMALVPLAWPSAPLFEGELSIGTTVTVPASHDPLGRSLVFSGELVPGQQQDNYRVELGVPGSSQPTTTLTGQLEAHQERRKIGRGAKKTITVAHLTRVHVLPASTADQALTLRLVSGNPMHVAVRGGEIPVGYALVMGLLLAVVAGLTEQIPVTRFGATPKKPAPRSAAAIATIGAFTAAVTLGAHPPIIMGVLVFAVASILVGMMVAGVVNLFRPAPATTSTTATAT